MNGFQCLYARSRWDSKNTGSEALFFLQTEFESVEVSLNMNPTALFIKVPTYWQHKNYVMVTP